MKEVRIKAILVLIIACFTISIIGAEAFTNISDCLVTNDIGIYSYKEQRANIGKGSGVVGLAGHFDLDHEDTVCTGRYSNINQIRGLPHEEIRQKLVSVKVQVTQHAGSDSDRWLLHEVEKSFRTYYGIPGGPYAMRVIDGNTVMAYGSAGWTYRWISNNKVIHISYHDSQMEKPEPLEAVKAYLAKHPSTLTPITSADLRTDANKTTWIKNEMDRRLWLGDKWIARIETVGDLNELGSVVKSLNVFLDYREKYYGIEAATEKQTLSEYLLAKNQAGIKTELEEYKTWWAANKDNPITL